MLDQENLDQIPERSAAPQPRTRKRRWLRMSLWTLASLVTLLVLAAVVGVLWLRSSAIAALPTLDGDLHLAGLSAPVTVRRDAHGVPHIEAATEDDLFVAQGYVTAQDRLWQMDAFRRNANGELSEIMGPSLVRHDKTQRTLQFRNSAQRIYANLPAADRARLDDYARGVNLFIEQHRDSLPAEFKLLFYRPRPWTGVDSVSIGMMMVQMLDTHFYAKLTREQIAAKLHDPKLEADLYPTGSWRDHPPTGIQLDLSQPHPVPPPTEDPDDDDPRTQASGGTRAPSEDSGLRVVGSHPFAGNKAKGWGTGHSARFGPGSFAASLAATNQAAPGERIGGSHPFARNKAKEWGTGHSARFGPDSFAASLATANQAAPGERIGGSHPFAGNKAKGWGTGHSARFGPDSFAASLATANQAAPDERTVGSHPFARNKAKEWGTGHSARSGPGSFAASYPATNQAAPGDGEDIRALKAALGLPTCDGCAAGSNNWVISGQHTASGKPLLSNDMHLGLMVPNIWFMANLKADGKPGAPGFHAAGVTLPGMPFVIAGHNEHIAWGFTALYADVQDLYVEKLDGKGNYQAADGTWKPLAVDHELIRVRGGKDVALDVQFTAHGPLLNPTFTKEKRPISLEWTLYDPALNQLPIYPMNVAANWAEFSAALGTWCWPTQNVVYSDDQGHIAYHAVGRVPIRPGGLAGVPIEDATHEWKGYIPFDDMPNSVDPPSGFLATANARVTTDKSPYPLTLEWSDPYRTERIYKLLQGRDKLTPKDLLAVQTDVYSELDQEFAHRFAYAIDHTDGADDRLKKAADLMRSWDGRLSTDSVAASLETYARYALAFLIMEPKLGKDLGNYDWSESNVALEEIAMHGGVGWIPAGYKNWDAVLTDAVRKGMERGHAPHDLAKWTYGSWHVVDLEHPLTDFLPYVSRVAGTGEQPLSGDVVTVKQVGRAFGPSQRFTMDWSNIDGSTENIVLGESGDPLSPYFRDQWSDYYGGTTFALPFTPGAVAAQTRHTQRLLP